MSHSRHSLFVAVVCLGLIACGTPTIESFRAEPLRVCRGDTVALHWQATGDVRLESEPSLPVSGSYSAMDTVEIVLQERTLFRLSALGGEDYAEQEVLVYRSGQLDTLSAPTAASGDSALTATIDVPPGKWEDILRIRSMTGLSDRPLTIWHEGHEAMLPADGSPSTAFEGVPIGGHWELYAPLISGETMGDPENPPPSTLEFLVRLECQR